MTIADDILHDKYVQTVVNLPAKYKLNLEEKHALADILCFIDIQKNMNKDHLTQKAVEFIKKLKRSN